MPSSNDMTTLTEAIEAARKKGYTRDFTADKSGFLCKETNEKFEPEDLLITKTYRFEGQSDPDDMEILYLMDSNSGTKGIFVEAYGVYGDFDDFDLSTYLKRIKFSEHH